MTETAAPTTPAQRAALAAATALHGQTAPWLSRGKQDLRHRTVTAATLRALARRGLVELVWAEQDVYSRAGLHYKGRRTFLDGAHLTAAGIAAAATA